eukprot:COSAG01_NODE_8061_length_2935_cov_31.857284_1_plen_89_part_00
MGRAIMWGPIGVVVLGCERPHLDCPSTASMPPPGCIVLCAGLARHARGCGAAGRPTSTPAALVRLHAPRGGVIPRACLLGRGSGVRRR